jgi:hypothetical protein
VPAIISGGSADWRSRGRREAIPKPVNQTAPLAESTRMLAGLISLWILGQKLRDPGGYVSSDVRYMEIRSMVRYLAGPARAAGRDDSAQRDLSKRIRGFGNQNINGIVTRQGGAPIRDPAAIRSGDPSGNGPRHRSLRSVKPLPVPW